MQKAVIMLMKYKIIKKRRKALTFNELFESFIKNIEQLEKVFEEIIEIILEMYKPIIKKNKRVRKKLIKRKSFNKILGRSPIVSKHQWIKPVKINARNRI